MKKAKRAKRPKGDVSIFKRVEGDTPKPEPIDNSYSKPGYDGRLKYYEHLKSYWDAIAKTSFSDDYAGWKKLLRGYFARTKAFIKTKEREEIINQFSIIENNIREMDTASVSTKNIYL